jgi:hypothetical protein
MTDHEHVPGHAPPYQRPCQDGDSPISERSAIVDVIAGRTLQGERISR